MATSGGSSDAPVPLTRLLRQVSVEAREGRITGDQKSQLKTYLLSGGNPKPPLLAADDSDPTTTAPAAADDAPPATASVNLLHMDSKHSVSSGGGGGDEPPALVPLLRQLSAATRAGTLSSELRAILKRLILTGESQAVASAQQMLSDHHSQHQPAPAPAVVKSAPRVLVLTKDGAFKMQSAVLNGNSSSSSDIIRIFFLFLDGLSVFSAAAVNKMWRRVATQTFDHTKSRFFTRITDMFRTKFSNRTNFQLASGDRFTFDDWCHAYSNLALWERATKLRAARSTTNTGSKFREPIACAALPDRFPTILHSVIHTVPSSQLTQIVQIEHQCVSVYQTVGGWSARDQNLSQIPTLKLVQYLTPSAPFTIRQQRSPQAKSYFSVCFEAGLIAVAMTGEASIGVFPLIDQKYIQPKRATARRRDEQEAADAAADEAAPQPVCEFIVPARTVVEAMALITLEPYAPLPIVTPSPSDSKESGLTTSGGSGGSGSGRTWLCIGLSSGEVHIINAGTGKKVNVFWGPPEFDEKTRESWLTEDPNATKSDGKHDAEESEADRFATFWRLQFASQYRAAFDFGHSQSALAQWQAWNQKQQNTKSPEPFKPSHFIVRSINTHGKSTQQLSTKNTTQISVSAGGYTWKSPWQTLDISKTAIANAFPVACEICEIVSGKISKPFNPSSEEVVRQIWIYQCLASEITTKQGEKKAPTASDSKSGAASASKPVPPHAIVITLHHSTTGASLWMTDLLGRSKNLHSTNCAMPSDGSSSILRADVNHHSGLLNVICRSAFAIVDLQKSTPTTAIVLQTASGYNGFSLPPLARCADIITASADRHRYWVLIDIPKSAGSSGNQLNVYHTLDGDPSAGSTTSWRARIEGEPDAGGKWGPIRSFVADKRLVLVNYRDGSARLFNYGASPALSPTRSPFQRGDIVVSAAGPEYLTGKVQSVEGDRMAIGLLVPASLTTRVRNRLTGARTMAALPIRWVNSVPGSATAFGSGSGSGGPTTKPGAGSSDSKENVVKYISSGISWKVGDRCKTTLREHVCTILEIVGPIVLYNYRYSTSGPVREEAAWIHQLLKLTTPPAATTNTKTKK